MRTYTVEVTCPSRNTRHHENGDGGTLDPVADAAVEAIDASDPNDLVLMLDGGQRFTVRIIAGA